MISHDITTTSRQNAIFAHDMILAMMSVGVFFSHKPLIKSESIK